MLQHNALRILEEVAGFDVIQISTAPVNTRVSNAVSILRHKCPVFECPHLHARNVRATNISIFEGVRYERPMIAEHRVGNRERFT